MSADGCFDVADRVTELIDNGGNKISLHAIEGVLLTQAGIIDAAAFGAHDPEGMMKIWAAAVAQPAVDIDIVARACREAPGGGAPTLIVNLDELPRNAGGKPVREEPVTTALAQQQPV